MNLKLLEPIPESEVLVTLPFGSWVYGTNKPDSDRDYVKIINQDTGSLLLQFSSFDSQYQYPEEVDYIYTSEKNFWAKVRDGGNTVFFEALHTQEARVWLASRGLYPEEALIDSYYTPRMAKGYLGLAKRDVQTDFIGRRKHIERCIHYANMIMSETYINLKEPVPQLPTDLTSEECLQVIKYLRDTLKYD